MFVLKRQRSQLDRWLLTTAADHLCPASCVAEKEIEVHAKATESLVR